jgi:hypothetical protein
VPYSKIGGRREAWQVSDSNGNELAWQATENGLLFPVTLIPGELPQYFITSTAHATNHFVNQIHLRRLGLNRLEIGNCFFRILIDYRAGAIVEVLNLTSETHRTLNLVETTPEEREALKDDIHAAEAMGIQPVPGVPEGNIGWTSLEPLVRSQMFDVIEGGPLRGRVRLGRAGETWELTWSAECRILRWRANKGFRFTAVSASPYLPFDRCVGGSEYEWPSGPDDSEPPDHEIARGSGPNCPVAILCNIIHSENYGALGIVALDTNLAWTGAGSRRFVGKVADGPTEVAIAFPQWKGANTVLEARREHRVLRQPVLIQVTKDSGGHALIQRPADRVLEVRLAAMASAPELYQPSSLNLDGDWELSWCEKGAGPPTNAWRVVKGARLSAYAMAGLFTNLRSRSGVDQLERMVVPPLF